MPGDGKMDGTDEESQEHRERRIADLWKTLDVSGRGELDFNGLRKGLRKIDHRAKWPTTPHDKED